MALQYNLPERGAVLNVRLIEARNLKAADVGGKSDPYVKLACGDATAKSKTIKVRWSCFFLFRTSVVSVTSFLRFSFLVLLGKNCVHEASHLYFLFDLSWTLLN
jgi:Ca2+-dependent lipid-binding protein